MKPRLVLSSVVLIAAIYVMLASMGGFVEISALLLPAIFLAITAIALIVVGAALIVGAPLRLVKRAWAWWGAHSWISWTIAAVGLALFAQARLTASEQLWIDRDGFSHLGVNPHPVLVICGMFLLAFGLLWAPRRPRPGLATARG